jgi:hypothetical protein
MNGLALCGTLLGAAATAHAQQPVGTVIGVPRWELGSFIAANAAPGTDRQGRVMPANTVTVLHVAPDFSSEIVTVGVTRQDGNQPAPSIYFPTYGNRDISRAYTLINAFDSWALPILIGEGSSAVLKMDVVQGATGFYTPGKTRFLLLPGEFMGEIMATNAPGTLRIVHWQRTQIGGANRDVALVAVEADGRLASGNASVQVPNAVYPNNLSRLVRSLNSNVTALGTDITGSGNSTTLEVK